MRFPAAIHLPFFARTILTVRGNGNANGLRARSLQGASNQSNGRPMTSGCTVGAIAYMQIPGEADVLPNGADEEFGCDSEEGFLPLDLDEGQRGTIREMAAHGGLQLGESEIDVEGATVDEGGRVNFPPGKAISVVAKNNNPFARALRSNDAGGRKLQVTNKHFILFRVTDVNNLVYGHDAATMSDNLFGTGTDAINLKSQMEACSHGRYNIVPNGKGIYDITGLQSAPGVVDIQLTTSIDAPRSTVRNDILAKAREVMGNHFGLSTGTSLTTYMDHALFSLKACYQDCGWAAYASAPGYYQVYQAQYYGYAGVQLHEHGHNMQLAHSGGLDGATYTDHTCAMGNPLYGDDLGQMCFNPAKNWQLQFYPHSTYVGAPWYDSADFLELSGTIGPRTVKMMGIGEYNLNAEPRKYVAVKILTSGTPLYVAFNSAKGANAQNDQADDQVTIIEKSGDYYGVSYLESHLAQDGVFTTVQGPVISAQCINTAVTPSLACVCIRDNVGQTCPSDCACEDLVCSSDTDCGGDTPVCDVGTGQCVACVGDGDCASGTPFCVSNQCVACGSDSDCDWCGGETCQLGSCAAGSIPCPQDTCTARTCDAANFQCIEDPVLGCCIDAGDCPAPTDACSQATCSGNVCGTEAIANCCQSDADCDWCGGDTCVSGSCTSGPERCVADACNPLRTCDAANFQCNDGATDPGCCLDAGDCPAPPACFQATCNSNACGTEAIANCCTSDADCAAPEFCNGNVCFSCASYTDKGLCNNDGACAWTGNPNSGSCGASGDCIPQGDPCSGGGCNDCCNGLGGTGSGKNKVCL